MFMLKIGHSKDNNQTKQGDLICPSCDPIIHDCELTFIIYAFISFILFLAASVHLTGWPGDIISDEAKLSVFTRLLHVFAYCGPLIVFLYFFSHPSRTMIDFTTLGACLLTFGIFLWGEPRVDVVERVLGAFGFAFFIAFLLHIVGITKRNHSYLYEIRLRWLLFLGLLFLFITYSMLRLTTTFHPQTPDLFAFHLDALLSTTIVPHVVSWVNAIPGGETFILALYRLGTVPILIVGIRQLNGRKPYVCSAILVSIIMTGLACIAYQFCPMIGPYHHFGFDFAQVYTHPDSVGYSIIAPMPTPRNAMPSMHFGWVFAGCILWFQSDTHFWSRLGFVLATFFMAVATLYTGEHYLIDLIVAVPFVLSSIALATTGISFKYKPRVFVIVAGYLTWFVWILFLRLQWFRFVDYPWVAYLLVFSTMLVVIYQAYLMSGFKTAPQTDYSQRCLSQPITWPSHFLQYSMMLFVASLFAFMYWVVVVYQTTLLFSNETSVIFSAFLIFLGGVGLGFLIVGYLSHSIRKPITLFALLQGGIGLYCLLTPWVIQALQTNLWNWLGGVSLLFPACLMGASFSLLIQASVQGKPDSLGVRFAGLFYMAVLGASVGVLLTTYGMLAWVGVKTTTTFVGLVFLLLTLMAFGMAKTLPEEGAFNEKPESQVLSVRDRLSVFVGLMILGLMGFFAMGLQAIYVPMLATVAESHAYVFGLMLAIFLFGLFLGGISGQGLLLNQFQSGKALILALISLSICVAVTLNLWPSIPDYYASFAHYPVLTTFSSHEAIRGITYSLALLPSAWLIGAAYVLAMDWISKKNLPTSIRLLSLGFMVNLLGCLLGVFVFHFILIPWIGNDASLNIITYANLILGLTIMTLTLGRHSVIVNKELG
jgi:hypothetical protein